MQVHPAMKMCTLGAGCMLNFGHWKSNWSVTIGSKYGTPPGTSDATDQSTTIGSEEVTTIEFVWAFTVRR